MENNGEKISYFNDIKELLNTKEWRKKFLFYDTNFSLQPLLNNELYLNKFQGIFHK